MARVVLDFDGVLIRGDSTVELLRRVVAREPWRAGLVLPAAGAFALVGHGGLLRTPASRLVVASAFVGRRLEDVESQARNLAEQLLAQGERVPARPVAALRNHLERGDEVLVSSAGLEPFVRAWVERLVPGAPVVVAASVLAQGAAGVVLADHHHGAGKVDRARALGLGPPFDAVYTDSSADLPLLEHARAAVLVNPGRRTLATLPARIRARAEVWD